MDMMDNTVTKQPKRIAKLSVVALLVSILGANFYTLASTVNGTLLIDFVFITVVSLFMPAVAKYHRSRNQYGKTAEILSIIIAGCSFYMIVFELTSWSAFIGYLGWVVSGLVYKFVY